LLIVVDHDKGMFDMAILQPKDDKGKHEAETPDSDATMIKFDLNKLHVMEKIKWHRQTSDMVSRELIQATVDVGKLQKIISKLIVQLKQEKVINSAKMVRIHNLENKSVSLGTNPKNGEVVKALVKD
jgi:hypothetical protein